MSRCQLHPFWSIRREDGSFRDITLDQLRQVAKVVTGILDRPHLQPLTLGLTLTDDFSEEEASALAVIGVGRVLVEVRRPLERGQQIAKTHAESWLESRIWPVPSDPEYADILQLFTEHVTDDLQQRNPLLRSWPLISTRMTNAPSIVETRHPAPCSSHSEITTGAPKPNALLGPSSVVPANRSNSVTAPNAIEIHDRAGINSHSDLVSNVPERTKAEISRVATKDFGLYDPYATVEPKPACIPCAMDSLPESHGTRTQVAPLRIRTANEILLNRIELSSNLHGTGIAPDITTGVAAKFSGFIKAADPSLAKIPTVSMMQVQAMIVPNISDRKLHIQPDFAHIHREFEQNRKTLTLLWQQYQNSQQGQRTYQYSQFCKSYQRWLAASQKAPVPTGQSP